VEEIRVNDELTQMNENTTMENAQEVEEFDEMWSATWKPILDDKFQFHDDTERDVKFLDELEELGMRNNTENLAALQGIPLNTKRVESGGELSLSRPSRDVRDSMIPKAQSNASDSFQTLAGPNSPAFTAEKRNFRETPKSFTGNEYETIIATPIPFRSSNSSSK